MSKADDLNFEYCRGYKQDLDGIFGELYSYAKEMEEVISSFGQMSGHAVAVGKAIDYSQDLIMREETVKVVKEALTRIGVKNGVLLF